MTNPLYPVFLRLDNLRMLVVGAGEVGEEKLRFILKSSPNADITVVAPWMGPDLQELLDKYEYVGEEWVISASTRTGDVDFTGDKLMSSSQKDQFRPGKVRYWAREFRAEDVVDFDLIVAATNITEVNHAVHAAAKKHRRLVNVADTPHLCDFYLGSIVTRGPLKVAISTNGQSPTFAKRFRQWLEAELPASETPALLNNLKIFRDRLTGDFAAKVKALNDITASLLAKEQTED
ncbi:MAG: bifunctional precorrin-2 dehydrogenase/sirohydrochlorin ferrochelatase [Bacteroidota bacterium]